MKRTPRLHTVNLTKVTPLFVVDAIEPALATWTGPLGFTKVAEVPHDDRVGFVILERDGREVMLQTKKSIAADLPALASVTCALYVDVPSLDDTLAALEGHVEVLVPPRDTFYGAREAFVRDPSGNVVGFAQHTRDAH